MCRATNVLCERCRNRRGASSYDERHRRPRILRVWPIELRFRRVDDVALLDVAHDADDCAHSATAGVDQMSECVAVWPVLLGERLADDDDAWRALHIGIGEISTGEQRNSQRGEKSRGHDVACDHERALRRLWTPSDGDAEL